MFHAALQVVFSNSLMLGSFKGMDNRKVDVMRQIEASNKQMLIDELKKVLEQKGAFMSSVSHELRTPLNGIIGEYLLESDHLKLKLWAFLRHSLFET